MTRRLLLVPALGTAFFLMLMPATAQMRDNQEQDLKCKDREETNRICEMRETTVPASARLEVNAGPNGGVSVKGWLKAQVLVRARVEAWGDSAAEAKKILSEVSVNTGGGRIRTDGPRGLLGKQNWSVSLEVFVPQRTDIVASTTNGGVNVSDVKGDIKADTTNGGIHLARLAGRVKGDTTNGGVHVELEGSRWDGDSLEVDTTNGGISVDVAENYSARFEASTTNGGLSTNLTGATVKKGLVGRSMSFTAGSGGPLIKLETTNGGISIGRGKTKRAEI
jgi:DUF4097 and DUF4098 domain-containing protein YvlB